MGLERRWLQAVTTALAICLLSVCQGEASLARAREGGSAELSCNLNPPAAEGTSPNLFPLHVVEWVRLGYNVPVLIKFGVYAPRVHPNYKGRVSLTRDASLLVERLTLEDEGWFECRILLLDREQDDFRNGTWTFLSITAPPMFIKTPPTFVEVLLGDSLTLSCGAHGNPRPTVVWHKDDSRIEKHEKIKVHNGSLSLTSVTRNISGVYKCHVSNSEGNLTHSLQLQVKGPPIILISPEDTTLNMSQDALLQCQADAYPSNLTYEWMKQGQNVYHIESLKSRVKVLVDGTLLIPNLIPEDAGNYTCVPTNGLMTPPTASAQLTVKHPARVARMPRQTFLPAGMGGVIICPVQADPPVLYVNWTKDGNDLNLDNYPGWMVNSEGSVFITTANDNAVGMYTCTPYNSYGTLGRSEPTQVILQDPPTFRVRPRPEYLQEVGRELIIPCEASGDPTPNVTWSKIGPSPRSQYTELANGSLLLKPLSKDHHGGWECLATNRVATVSASTVVMVLGTSPHAVSSVIVTTEMNQANVSWVPGFDGGYTQKFTVWFKQSSRGKHEWASLPVPTSKNYLLVTGLLAGTGYQFSVLPQNKLGSGPFSEIVSVRTQAVPTEKPASVTTLPVLEPPFFLTANQTDEGLLLQWLPPEAPSSPLTGFILQARRDQGQWFTLNKDISANQSELLVKELFRDCIYDLRVLSQSSGILSKPSESISVSTFGMEVYPVRPSFLESIPKSLFAGVVGGLCFLCVAIILSFGTACYMRKRRSYKHRKRRQDLSSALHKTDTRSPPRSPDSVLKLKLCPPLPFFPNSSSSQSDRSSFDKGSRGEYQDQRKQLLANSSPPPHYTLFESHLGCQAPSPSGLESISRGPDGRFIVQPLQEVPSPSKQKRLKEDVLQINGGPSGSGSNRTSFRDSPKSSVLSSDKDERKNSSLTVNVQELSRPPSSPGRVRAMARNFSRHGCFYSDDEQGSEALLERASFYSDNSEKKPSDALRRHRLPCHAEDLFPSLGKRSKLLDRNRLNLAEYQPMESNLTNESTLVSRLDCELERDSVSKCVQLAREREEIERELESYTAGGRLQQEEEEEEDDDDDDEGEEEEEEPVWKPQDVTLRQKHRPAGQTSRVSDYRRACYFGSTSSPMDRRQAAHIQWDISPVTSVTNLVPVRSPRHCVSPRGAPQADSFVVDSFRSPVTQNTSLPLLSPDATLEGPVPVQMGQPADRGAQFSPQRKPDAYRRSMTEQGLAERTEGAAVPSRSRHSYAYTGAQGWDSVSSAGPPGVDERPTSPSAAPHQHQSAAVTRELSPSGFNTPTRPAHQETGAKAKEKEARPRGDPRAPRLTSDLEREGVRTRSRRSDKCLYSDSPSSISTLTLVEEAESDQSHFSVPVGASGSFRTKPAAPSPRLSPLQTSAILEYLSLPGFIEMSVDEPIEEESRAAQSSEPTQSEKSSETKPDVVPKNWEVHVQEQQDGRKVCFDPAVSVGGTDLKLSYRQAGQREGRASSPRVRFPDETKPPSPDREKTCKQIYTEKTQTRIVGRNPDRPESRLASRSAHTLLSAAKEVANIVSTHSQSFVRGGESLSERTQRANAQGASRTNNIVSRISQAPGPFLKKSMSVGPCRSLVGFAQPRPHLKKSFSLGSHRWEHFETPRTYISDACYWDELPHPDVRSYSLGRSPPPCPRPGPSWREYIPTRRPSVGSLERPHRSLASPSYLMPSMYSPGPTSLSPTLEPVDPRRQAAVFPESARWSPSYQDMLRSAQHKYVPPPPPPPRPSSIPLPQYQPCPPSRGEFTRPMEPVRGPPRSYLPRGISWPSPYYPPVPLREGDAYSRQERMAVEAREGGRASYASQSSGRGSAGLFRQSLSITPTLLSSPETTEESERHRADMDLPERRRPKRRNTSVDESYEWDSADAGADSEVPEAAGFDPSWGARARLGCDQAGGLRDRQREGQSPPIGQYSRSLSEDRFNALRREYQEYRRAQESVGAPQARLVNAAAAGRGSDSDSGSALL